MVSLTHSPKERKLLNIDLKSGDVYFYGDVYFSNALLFRKSLLILYWHSMNTIVKVKKGQNSHNKYYYKSHNKMRWNPDFKLLQLCIKLNKKSDIKCRHFWLPQ